VNPEEDTRPHHSLRAVHQVERTTRTQRWAHIRQPPANGLPRHTAIVTTTASRQKKPRLSETPTSQKLPTQLQKLQGKPSTRSPSRRTCARRNKEKSQNPGGWVYVTQPLCPQHNCRLTTLQKKHRQPLQGSPTLGKTRRRPRRKNPVAFPPAKTQGPNEVPTSGTQTTSR